LYFYFSLFFENRLIPKYRICYSKRSNFIKRNS